jgi:hypothetical protein
MSILTKQRIIIFNVDVSKAARVLEQGYYTSLINSTQRCTLSL